MQKACELENLHRENAGKANPVGRLIEGARGGPQRANTPLPSFSPEAEAWLLIQARQ